MVKGAFLVEGVWGNDLMILNSLFKSLFGRDLKLFEAGLYRGMDKDLV